MGWGFLVWAGIDPTTTATILKTKGISRVGGDSPWGYHYHAVNPQDPPHRRG